MPKATPTNRSLPMVQKLAAEVFDRRMVGNLLVIEVEKYIGTRPDPNTATIRAALKEWRRIPPAR